MVATPQLGHRVAPLHVTVGCEYPWQLSHCSTFGLSFLSALDHADPKMRKLLAAASGSVTTMPLAVSLTRIGLRPVALLTSSYRTLPIGTSSPSIVVMCRGTSCRK